MAAPKRPTHVVTHDSFYLAVKGKLEEIPRGTRLTLTDKQVGNAVEKGFLKSVKDFDAMDLANGEVSNPTEEIKTMEAEIKKLTDQAVKDAAEVKKLTEQSEKDQAEIKKLTVNKG